MSPFALRVRHCVVRVCVPHERARNQAVIILWGMQMDLLGNMTPKKCGSSSPGIHSQEYDEMCSQEYNYSLWGNALLLRNANVLILELPLQEYEMFFLRNIVGYFSQECGSSF